MFSMLIGVLALMLMVMSVILVVVFSRDQLFGVSDYDMWWGVFIRIVSNVQRWEGTDGTIVAERTSSHELTYAVDMASLSRSCGRLNTFWDNDDHGSANKDADADAR
jgi:hypothetical protein